jgi:plastocyanin
MKLHISPLKYAITTSIFALFVIVAISSNLSTPAVSADHMHDHRISAGVVSEHDASGKNEHTVHQIDISGFAFSPRVITITQGDTIVWTNRDIAQHNVVFSGGFSSNILSTQQSATNTFNTVGSFDYFCSLHSGMTGVVNVVSGGHHTPTSTAQSTVTPQPTATGTPQPTATGTPLPPCLIASLVLTKENASITTNASGNGTILLDTRANKLYYYLSYQNLSSAESVAHFHGPAALGSNAPPLITIASGQPKQGVWEYTDAQESQILGNLVYVNIHTINNPAGELRAQLQNFAICKQVELPAIFLKK